MPRGDRGDQGAPHENGGRDRESVQKSGGKRAKLDRKKHNEILNKTVNIAAWTQVLGVLFALGGLIYLYRRYHRGR
ncbi:hypothetical protein [Hydrogenimonas sp.]